MTEVLFYHLQDMTLESVLPPLLEKSLERGWRVVVQSTSQERTDALDAHLWTYRDDSFLPHATWRAGDAQDQPILLAVEEGNPNRANVRFLIDSAPLPADSDAYEFGMIATGRPYPVPFTAGKFPGWRNRPLRGEVNDGNAAHALGGVAGHAGLFATVADLLRLGAALRGGDFVPSAVLARFATPVPACPGQAVGFRRASAPAGGAVLTLLYHGGFTGTYFAFGLEDELVLAGGAMRLYGTLGAIPADGRHPDVSHLVAGTDIQSVLLDAALQVFEHGSTYATPAEEQ